jgi:hypothetical protein
MSDPGLFGLSLLAKNHPFFVPSLATMQSVPDQRGEKTEEISDDSRDHD